jgi:hypothetical protein
MHREKRHEQKEAGATEEPRRATRQDEQRNQLRKKADRKRRHTESEHQKGVKSKQQHLSALSLIRHGTSIRARSVPIPAAPSDTTTIEKR